MEYAKLQNSAQHLIAEEKQINALLTTIILVNCTACSHHSKTIILNLLALYLLFCFCDKTTDLIVHQAARNQRLKQMVNDLGEWY